MSAFGTKTPFYVAMNGQLLTTLRLLFVFCTHAQGTAGYQGDRELLRLYGTGARLDWGLRPLAVCDQKMQEDDCLPGVEPGGRKPGFFSHLSPLPMARASQMEKSEIQGTLGVDLFRMRIVLVLVRRLHPG